MSKRKRKPTILDRLEIAVFYTVRAIISLIGARASAAMLAWVGRTLGPRLWVARRADENLRARLPELDAAQRRSVIAAMMDGFARTCVEYFNLPKLHARAGDWRVEGLEHLRAAQQAAGGRMVVVTAHYGQWEAVRGICAREGAPLALIYRAFNNPLFDRIARDTVESIGAPAFHKGKRGARELFLHVARKGGAMILVDQRMGGAPLIDFIGAPAETSLAAAQLALRLDVPILPAVARREGEGFVVRFEPPIAPDTPEAMMGEVNRVIGGWVRAHPEQWFWLHRRWKVRAVRGERVRKASARSEAPLSSPD
ncbi:MAG: lysophospholipid acyltransferase family protein [Neomegalonema sp.]|nr:lysophospholipid acyltransferase family protein [Neomegalonema sp.]